MTSHNTNKVIHRDGQSSATIFDERTVENDYRTLVPLLREGMRVLDVGCGTGSISNGIAKLVGGIGHVTGIDNTAHFIEHGRALYRDTTNLKLIHSDLFNFDTDQPFDLVVSARTLQWLSNPGEAIAKMKRFLRSGGTLSILDYNHSKLTWTPAPPKSMRDFYAIFLQWRADARMNNLMGDSLAELFTANGLSNVEVRESNEVYTRGEDNFVSRLGIWSKVAGLKQIVDEGYLHEADRVKTIHDYMRWVEDEAQQMIMDLKEVRGTVSV
ncbi:class I SAM-dependent methyltransferase [Pseudochryseolinea flava]|uniref:Methyltransferase n=1 Tax=Pseudochryseolinea flava TaxID=2059302 RepID=A0A364XXE0_9BACT|nr:class I SAM-dependent methyltransferase [Pseudochryseolinea flava]RAV98951.1 methyltransferase [Pseudochryseolinea flava]